MKASADLQQGAHAPVNLEEAGCRACNTRENLEERRFSRAVAADDANHFPLLHLKRDISKGPHELRLGWPKQFQRRPDGPHQNVPQGEIPLSFANAILLAQTFGANDRGTHRSDDISDRCLHSLEVHESGAKNHGNDSNGCEQQTAGRLTMARQSPAKSFNDTSHRIQAEQPPPALRNKTAWIGYRRSKHPKLNQKRHDIPNVTINRVQ